MNENKLIEIIWFGRGGQGVVTASQLTAAAALYGGYEGVSAVPSFGAERRGAPVEAYLRLSKNKINIYSNIETADYIVIFDDSLIEKVKLSSLKKGLTKLIINTSGRLKSGLFDNYDISEIYCIDASKISRELNLTAAGNLIINTTMIGAFLKVLNSAPIDNLKTVFSEKFSKNAAELNYSAAQKAYIATFKL